jgi:hypothetical protein
VQRLPELRISVSDWVVARCAGALDEFLRSTGLMDSYVLQKLKTQEFAGKRGQEAVGQYGLLEQVTKGLARRDRRDGSGLRLSRAFLFFCVPLSHGASST